MTSNVKLAIDRVITTIIFVRRAIPKKDAFNLTSEKLVKFMNMKKVKANTIKCLKE